MFDNCAADTQIQTASLFAGCHEWLEDGVLVSWRDSNPRIADFNNSALLDAVGAHG
jgi:hypothetical protein